MTGKSADEIVLVAAGQRRNRLALRSAHHQQVARPHRGPVTFQVYLRIGADVIALVVHETRGRGAIQIDQHLVDGLASLVNRPAIHPLAFLREQPCIAGVVARILEGRVIDQHAADGQLVLDALQSLLDGERRWLGCDCRKCGKDRHKCEGLQPANDQAMRVHACNATADGAAVARPGKIRR